IYAHHIPNTKREGVDYFFIDQGFHEFKYLLLPHKGSWKDVFYQISNLSDAINLGLDYIVESCHTGVLPRMFSFLSVSDKNVYLAALKRAESSDDVVLRMLEQTGEEREVNITLKTKVIERIISAKIKPFELKTIVVPVSGSKKEYETNLLEEPKL
ncbi:hypothetical protein JHC27_00545, partial [archaeon]|nr:hypothetical protein [archaeon]